MMFRFALICLLSLSTGCAGQFCCIRTYISTQRILSSTVELSSDGQVIGQSSGAETKITTIQKLEFFCKLPSTFKQFGPRKAEPDPEARGRLTSR